MSTSTQHLKVYRWSVEAYMAGLQPVRGGGR
jgi:hypothetical protein